LTINEFHIEFKIGLDKVDSLNLPNFLDEEIDVLLNQAQERYVKQRYGLTNTKKQSFEETQKRTEDLKVLVTNSVITPIANSVNNIDEFAVFCNLPDNHWFIIQERARISFNDAKGDTNNEVVPIRPIQHNDFNKIMLDPFNKPDETEILRIIANGKVELISSNGVTITEYLLRYIRKPIEMSLATNTTCELSDHTHQEILQMSIDIALENIEAKRQQTFKTILNTEE